MEFRHTLKLKCYTGADLLVRDCRESCSVRPALTHSTGEKDENSQVRVSMNFLIF